MKVELQVIHCGLVNIVPLKPPGQISRDFDAFLQSAALNQQVELLAALHLLPYVIVADEVGPILTWLTLDVQVEWFQLRRIDLDLNTGHNPVIAETGQLINENRWQACDVQFFRLFDAIKPFD